ncbi:MAG: gliding motility-associated C-terminal domain-containing protein [Cyclobacteriaceae bacterium]|nr:gliding motility-associated C-terminal domain-containing protein [Cyclobacteriaceae bacterium]
MNRKRIVCTFFWIGLVLASLTAHAQYPELNWAQNFGSTLPLSDAGNAVASDAAGNIYVTGHFSGTVDFDNGPGTVNLTSAGSTDVFVAKFNSAGDLIWAKGFGGTQGDGGTAIAIDGVGNVLIAGGFRGTADLDPGPGVVNFTSAGETDILACKLDANGNFLWAYAVGGISFDNGNSIALNTANDVVVTGNFRQTVDFDPGPGVTSFTNVGLDDSFIVKLNGATGGLLWAKQVECGTTDVTIDASNNILTTGAFIGTVDFDPGAGVFQLTGIANEAFVLKMDDNGNFVWAVSMGGNSDDVAQAIRTDVAGNVYTAGKFVRGDGSPHDFDPGPGVFQLTPVPDINPSNSDIYVSKLTASGGFIWAKHLGGIGAEEPFALALDATGNVYTTGYFQGTVDFDPGSSSYSFTADGFANIYTSKLNASGDFVWVERPGGSYTGFGRGIAIDNANQVIVSGNFSNTADFSAGSCDFNLTSNGQSDIFVQKLSQTGPPPPYIASFTPIIGLSGTVVTLTGTNFDPTPANNTVKFNGMVAVVTASTATSITTSVPVGATTGFITVSVGCATGISQVPYTVDSCVPADEKNALVQLYNATDGANWTNNANWLTTDVSTWYGVTVTGCSVTEIQLGDNGLTGYLPYDLVDLNALVVFDVNENNLGGYIPDGFVSMPNLITLNLSNNNFTVLPNLTTGSLNTALLDLDVSSNALDFGDLEPNIAFANLTYAPQAEIPPAQLVGFTLGGTLTINFSTPGTANAYQWFKEGASISGATNTILTIPSATLAQAGNYTVEITNSLVPGLTLRSAIHQAVASPCAPGPRNSGQLDVTFNHAIDNQTYVGGVAVQSTGKVIVALPTTSIGGTPVIGTVRFNTDGSLDGTFNIIPEYMIPLIQTDDKILGYNYDQVIRYNADGTEDIAFNGNAPQSYSSTLYAMALQPDGKIVYSAEGYMSSPEFTRLNTDGTPDPSFTGPSLVATVIKVQADGKIVIVSNNIVSRLNADGSGDLSFSVGLANGGSVSDIAIQPDGKILITGNFTGVDGVPHFGIARVNSDGTVDNTFSAIGIAELAAFDGPYKIGLMSNGQIILAGHFNSVNGAPRKNLVRLNTDGSIDCGFDPGTSTNDYISGMALQSDDKILITGYFTDYDGAGRLGLARIINGGATITITTQPSDITVCAGQPAAFTTAATGTTNITYQWQFSPNGSPLVFADFTNGANYSGATTATLTVNTTAGFGAGRYRCKVNGDLAATVYTNDMGLFINPIPTAPTATGASLCGSGSVTLTASGGSNGQYKWYTTATGGAAIPGETNGSYVTPSLSATTTYHATISITGCESTRTPVIATITNTAPPTGTGVSSCPGSTFTLTASGGSNGQYKWYNTATGGTPIAGAVNGSYTTPMLTSTTTYYVTLTTGTCESNRTPVTATISSTGCAPVIASDAKSTQVEGKVEFDLSKLITTSGTLDPASIKVISPPSSGAIVTITNNILTIDYSGRPYTGTESIIIEACNTNGFCSQQTLTIEVTGDLIIYNALSPNGDLINPIFLLQNIEVIPETKDNKVTIFNRWGDIVFEVDNYDNITRVFSGQNKSGNELPSGTYFYRIDFSSGLKSKTGFLSLRR